MDNIKYFLVLLIVATTYYEVKARRYHSYNSDEEQIHPWENFLEIVAHNIKEGERFFKEEIQRYRGRWKAMMSSKAGKSSGSESSEWKDGKRRRGSDEDKGLVPEKAFKRFVVSLQCENSRAYRKLLKKYKTARINSDHAEPNTWLNDLVQEVHERPDSEACTPVSCTSSNQDPVTQPTPDVQTNPDPDNPESRTTTEPSNDSQSTPETSTGTSEDSQSTPETTTEPSDDSQSTPETSTESTDSSQSTPETSTEPSDVFETNPEPLTSTEPSEIFETNPEPLTSTEPSEVT